MARLAVLRLGQLRPRGRALARPAGVQRLPHARAVGPAGRRSGRGPPPLLLAARRLARAERALEAGRPRPAESRSAGVRGARVAALAARLCLGRRVGSQARGRSRRRWTAAPRQRCLSRDRDAAHAAAVARRRTTPRGPRARRRERGVRRRPSRGRPRLRRARDPAPGAARGARGPRGERPRASGRRRGVAADAPRRPARGDDGCWAAVRPASSRRGTRLLRREPERDGLRRLAPARVSREGGGSPRSAGLGARRDRERARGRRGPGRGPPAARARRVARRADARSGRPRRTAVALCRDLWVGCARLGLVVSDLRRGRPGPARSDRDAEARLVDDARRRGRAALRGHRALRRPLRAAARSGLRLAARPRRRARERTRRAERPLSRYTLEPPVPGQAGPGAAAGGERAGSRGHEPAGEPDPRPRSSRGPVEAVPRHQRRERGLQAFRRVRLAAHGFGPARSGDAHAAPRAGGGRAAKAGEQR